MNQKQEQNFSLCAGGVPFEAQDEDEKAILSICLKALELRRAKGKDYGRDSWRGLGAKGEFPFIYFKTQRLKSLLWDNKAPNFESVRVNLYDLFNFTLHTIVLYEEETSTTESELR